MYDLKLLVPNSVWRHKKGGIYVVIGVSTRSTNGQEGVQSVMYWSTKYQGLRDRLIGEFLDGRFVPLNEGDSHVR